MKVEELTVKDCPVRSNIEASEVIVLKEESETEQVPPEKLTRNVSEEIDVKCDPIIDKVPEDVIRDAEGLRDEK